jgi:hypothetical protein
MFVDDMPLTNVLGRGPRRGCDRWPVILVGEPMNILGPGGDLRLKHDLNRRIYGFYFFTTAYFNCLSGRGASKTDGIYMICHMHHNITHIHEIHNIIYNIVYDNFQTSSQQAKQLLWRHIVAAGSSHRVEETVDKVVYQPATLL